MRKVKLIVHETYQGKRKSEVIIAAAFLSNAAALTKCTWEHYQGRCHLDQHL